MAKVVSGEESHLGFNTYISERLDLDNRDPLHRILSSRITISFLMEYSHIKYRTKIKYLDKHIFIPLVGGIISLFRDDWNNH